MSTFTLHSVTEPLSENSPYALCSAELSRVVRGQLVCRAARARTVGNRKCDCEGHYCCVTGMGQNYTTLSKQMREYCVCCEKILL